jgi:transposase-like protein
MEKPESLNLIQLMERFGNAETARAYLESLRWPEGPVCPHCGVMNEATKLKGKSCRPGLYKCNGCKQQYTVTVRTIFEDSKIPLHKWVLAFHLLCASKKGLSSHQLHRMLGITYKSAWFMTQRIRYAMEQGTFRKLRGVVEADETDVGGKAKNAHRGQRTPKKIPVVALVERNGRAFARKVANVNALNVVPFLRNTVSAKATVMTDGAPIYDHLSKDFADHKQVNHAAGQYVKGDAHTQTVESFNSLLKRGLMGSYHHISEHHLDRYLSEFSFRWSHRKETDGTRTVAALQQSEGKRLTYRDCAERH